MEQVASSENREFRLHKDILWHVIQAQAGTLDKGLLELVMNSVDAGATRVDIELDESRFSVRDDGKGFVSREEIESFFETFGTPHQEGDAVYGKFRMGRGQIMAFSRNRWQSGPFRMDVNIRDQGLRYDLRSDAPVVLGCVIEGDLYDELRPSECLRMCQQLEGLVKYAPIPVHLNGERISADLDKEKWSFVDEDAYYLIKPDALALQVYNLGVHVRDYPAHQHGLGGIVVSKKPLQVNFARNDILVAKCAVWKRIGAVLRANAKPKDAKAHSVKTEAYRSLMASQLLSGQVVNLSELDQMFREEPLMTDIRGRHRSFAELATAVQSQYGGRLTVAAVANDRIGDALHATRQALVLAPRTLERFRVRSRPELLQKLARTHKKIAQNKQSAADSAAPVLDSLLQAYADIAEVGKHIANSPAPVDPKKLTREERRVLSALNKAQYQLLRGFGESVPPLRKVLAGESETALAWTDGLAVIYVDRRLLKLSGYHGAALSAMTQLGTLLLHEYLHEDDDTSTHMHNAEFFERFHDIAGTCGVLGSFACAALDAYIAARSKDGDALRRGELDELDRHHTLQRLAA